MRRPSTVLGWGVLAGERDAPRILECHLLRHGSATIACMVSRHALNLMRRGQLLEFVTLGGNLDGIVALALNGAIGRRWADPAARFVGVYCAASGCVLVARHEMAP